MQKRQTPYPTKPKTKDLNYDPLDMKWAMIQDEAGNWLIAINGGTPFPATDIEISMYNLILKLKAQIKEKEMVNVPA